jgi:hypothetical protein
MGALSTIAMVGAGLAAGAAVSKLTKTPKAPDLPDPRIERAKAETEAAQKTNSKLAQRNRARAASSLLAKPIDSTTSDVATLGAAPGKTTLGQ